MTLFRLDRLATLYLFYPLKCVSGRRNQIQIPILMYHSISDDNNISVYNLAYYRTNTSPRVFNEHMKFLYNNNYKVINLFELQHLFYSKQDVDDRYVVITFDDGLRDFYFAAYPILHKYNFTATVFLPTGYIGNRGIETFKGQECLIWHEVCELYNKGITFGSHTVTHPQLRYLSRKEIEYELRLSREMIENHTGNPVVSFSYPFAFPEEDKYFVNELQSILDKCGYRNGVSTRIGTVTNMENKYFLKRIPINSHDDIALFKAKIEGGYNWLYLPQYLSKKIKNSYHSLESK